MNALAEQNQVARRLIRWIFYSIAPLHLPAALAMATFHLSTLLIWPTPPPNGPDLSIALVMMLSNLF